MNTPRDRHVVDHVGLVGIARVYSNVVSPPVIFAALGLAFALRDLPFWPGFGWATLYGLLVSLLPILVVVYMLRTGRIEELHMSSIRERHVPYIAAVLSALLAAAALFFGQGPASLQCLAGFNVITLGALALINAVWLISIHSAAIAAAWWLVGLGFGWLPSLIVVPFLLTVPAVRLYLRRHTVSQVVGGLALGTAAVLVLLPWGCFT